MPCHCSSNQTCDCCRGVKVITPLSVENQPGLPALTYRVGTHCSFFERMKARLSTMTVDAVGSDGQTIQTYQPLIGLTTRNTDDFSIALLDGWATLGDVLTFYQERIANEGYLRTATERRSVVELSRLIGYSPRNGVAATVYLSYTLEDKQATPVTIPAGSRCQSIPGPGELPQSFETSDDLLARTEWNNLQVRLTRPQNITLDNVATINTVYINGTDAGLKKGDLLLFVFDSAGDNAAARTVRSTEAEFMDKRTIVHLQPLSGALLVSLPLIKNAIPKLLTMAKGGGTAAASAGEALKFATTIYQNTLLGISSDPSKWVEQIQHLLLINEVGGDPSVDSLLSQLDTEIAAALKQAGNGGGGPLITDPATFVSPLLKPLIPQARSSLSLVRSFAGAFTAGSDVHPQFLVQFAPQLRDNFYLAWSNASVNEANPTLVGLYAMRQAAPLFGSSVQKMATYDDKNRITTPDQWTEWSFASDESANVMFLDQVYETVLPGSFVLIHRPDSDGGTARTVQAVTAATTQPRTAYGISGKTTALTLPKQWFDTQRDTMDAIRGTFVHAQSDPLDLAQEPLTDDVSGQEIELQDLYDGWTSGRWVILSGERADIPGVSGVIQAELLMTQGTRNGFDPLMPGDKTHSTLLLSTKTAFTYKRETLKILGNVVKATNGETRNETMGSGDATQAFQSFILKQPPLTYVAAPTAAGAASTLKVYVNNIEWHETDTLAGAQPKDRIFITKTDDNANTTVIFGNGAEGSRTPTGVENIKAIYRNGLGKAGNVSAGQISLVSTKPLGVKDVINPLRASGGAEKESRDQARDNAPLAVLALDRLVSVEDYASFTRTFAGIAKAYARQISNGQRQVVEITIAGMDDIPIDPTSDLYQNLVAALHDLGDPALPIQVDMRELLVLAISAKVKISGDYLWDNVSAAIRADLLDAFGFEKRNLAQPAVHSEIIAHMQRVPGVVYVDVDVFGGFPEKISNSDGSRRLLTLEELAETAAELLGQKREVRILVKGKLTGPICQQVLANQADFENGGIRPAQLAVFTDAVPDSIILNQIS